MNNVRMGMFLITLSFFIGGFYYEINTLVNIGIANLIGYAFSFWYDE